MTTTARFTDIDSFLALFKGVKQDTNGWEAICPGHEGHPADRRSLSIKFEDNKIILHCHAGCDSAHVVESVGLKIADLFLTGDKQKQTRKTEVIYPYLNEKGNLLYQVIRTTPKGFYQQRPDGNGGFINNMNGVTPTIYQLPKIKTAISMDEPLIVIPEGEKDCDNCFRKLGIVATCKRWRRKVAI